MEPTTMEEEEKVCIACGMPMVDEEDFGCEDMTKNTCVFCTNEDGTMKSCEDIFEGGVEFFMEATGEERYGAERLTRRNMLSLPYWQENGTAILEGPQATDEEYSAMLALLMIDEDEEGEDEEQA